MAIGAAYSKQESVQAKRDRSHVQEPAMDVAIRKALDFLSAQQTRDGSWQGDYGGPMFLLPMYIACCTISKQTIPMKRKESMIAYFRNVQNRDGSIGLHAEDRGSMFTTVLSYVAMRLLGVDQDDPATTQMRNWIKTNGTALGAANWGKFILALLNLYPYDGLNPILPELWLLPYAAPIHPGRLWCHCRQVYLPMAYLYGARACMEENGLIRELRSELYNLPYDEIEFVNHRDTVAPSDNRFPVSRALKLSNRVMGAYEQRHSKTLRERALEELFDHIHYEDQVTHYIDIGPVNSILNTIVHYFKDPESAGFEKSLSALDCYLCDTPDGLKFNGYNSTALWDTAFSVQAMLASPFADAYMKEIQQAYQYIRDNQVSEDVPDRKRYFRHASKGGWPFSDRAHGWPITDCTAEGFKSVVSLEHLVAKPMDEKRLKDSVRLMLSFQNPDGGWATYEKKRGGDWLELLNPSQVFGDIMVDYSYVECTSACIQALVLAKRRFPGWMNRAIDRAARKGIRFIKKQQRPDGSWEGSWGVCFTYGTWFGVWGLIAGGIPNNAPEIRKANGFLIQRQNPDGGWGESSLSCTERRYVRAGSSHTVNTAWALMTLVRSGLADTASACRAADFLVQQQMQDGDWPREPMVGVFNKTSLINYENYRRYFPLWALGVFRKARTGNPGM